MTELTEKRLIALEEKIIYQEDSLHKLDEVVTRQYEIIDTLTRRVKNLENKIDVLQEEIEKQPSAPADEKPPHY